MKVIRATNVNDAYVQGLDYLRREGVREESRAGPVLVSPVPVTTVYERPAERVLFDPARDANPFFHLFEALWILAGRNDARWLDRFVRDFSSRFAEDDGHQHGAYGFRWRRHFDVEGGGAPGLPDQIETVVRLLREDPGDRRVVLTMWDPVADLGAGRRDIPCNTHIYPRVRTAHHGPDGLDLPAHDPTVTGGHGVLDLTVCCRSNDAIWGAYGANAVHFSVLQEYLAGRLGIGIGWLYQVSNNFHAYVDVLEKKAVGVDATVERGAYADVTRVYPVPIGCKWEAWDEDVCKFVSWAADARTAVDFNGGFEYRNSWFHDTAEPLLFAHWCWKSRFYHDAFTALREAGDMAPDWKLAAQQWFERRMK